MITVYKHQPISCITSRKLVLYAIQLYSCIHVGLDCDNEPPLFTDSSTTESDSNVSIIHNAIVVITVPGCMD